MLAHVEWNAVFVAVTALTILLVWDIVLAKRAKFFRLVQGPLVAVVFGITYQLITQLWLPTMALDADNLVSVPVPANMTEFFGLFQTPDWSSISKGAVWVTAITLAVVGSLETLLCLEATDKLDPLKRVTPTNRELVAQGVGNALSGTIGGLPITQVIVRSSANIQSGATSKASAILHGAFLLLAVLFLPNVLNYVPLPVLASILLVVGYKLAKPALFFAMYRKGWAQFAPFAVTVVGIVLTDLLTGIATGMAVAVILILRRNYLNSHFLHIKESDVAGKHSVRLQLAEEVTFLNKGAILRELSKVPNNSEVVIDMSQCVTIDLDVVEIIDDFVATATERGIQVRSIHPVSLERESSELRQQAS